MKKNTKLSVQWFYDLLERGECDIVDFKEQLNDKDVFGKSMRNFSKSYEELARDVVAFSNFKGGFVFIGIEDGTRKINQDFKYEEKKIWQLVAQIESRTTPPVILIPHRLNVLNCQLLVLEIPFSNQIHRTSKGEYLIRSNDCNRQIEPHELCTIQSEKGLMLFDQFVWREADTTAGDNGVPKWEAEITHITYIINKKVNCKRIFWQYSE